MKKGKMVTEWLEGGKPLNIDDREGGDNEMWVSKRESVRNDPALGLLTNPRKMRFIQHYINTGGQVQKSCNLAGIDTRVHYAWLKEDPVYAEAYAMAKARAIDVIDQEIIRRGVKGWKEPMFYQGKVVGYVRKYSDNLLMFRAKFLNPAYRDNHTGFTAFAGPGGNVNLVFNIPRPETPEDRQKKKESEKENDIIDAEIMEDEG